MTLKLPRNQAKT